MRLVSLTIVPLVLAAFACGSTIPPKELVDARAAYKRAEEGPAAQFQPAELHDAKVALEKAEGAFSDDADSPKTRDFAYVAQRKAERAEALGGASAEAKRKAEAEAEATRLQKDYIARKEGELDKAKGELSKTKGDLASQQKALEAEKAARIAAEKKAKDAMDALAKSMAVKEEARGTVITLSGNVLFASGQYAILPAAQDGLNKVADALKNMAEHTFIVEGHTDNVGKDSVNLELSRRRAEAVRDYLIVRGVSADMIKAIGKGPAVPVADNKNAEGRAMNRRVEIIVEPDSKK
jgi:outer membrane protein OmpA-like peptidoglycan-associated protein